MATTPYRAPEVTLRLGWNSAHDIWSVGCILLELFTGEMPFAAEDDSLRLAVMEHVIGFQLDPELVRQAGLHIKRTLILQARRNARKLEVCKVPSKKKKKQKN